MTIDVLPDVALLGIFDFYTVEGQVEEWHTLVHVCRTWRIVVFGSPRRLNLRLLCTARTPIREMLDVWPPLPIVVRGDGHGKWGVKNILAALEQNDRICQLHLVPFLQMEKVIAAMQKPFPELKRLYIRSHVELAPIDPDLFLGGSAPCLQTVALYDVPFPRLPDLLLSATQLVRLDLWYISHSGYISPEAMATCLSTLTKLERLKIGFNSPESLHDQRSRHPDFLRRILLPVLTTLWLQGTSEYLEDLLARINAPLLDNLTVSFFHQPIFDSPQLIQFINRTPKFEAHGQADLVFDRGSEAWVTFPQKFGGEIRLEIKFNLSDQLSFLAQICSSSVPPAFISAVEHLYVLDGASRPVRLESEIDKSPARWLELLHPFTAVKGLYVSWEFTPHVACVLQELVGERVTEALPTLQTLFLEETNSLGLIQEWKEAIGKFVAARQHVGQSIALSRWNGVRGTWYEIDETED